MGAQIIEENIYFIVLGPLLHLMELYLELRADFRVKLVIFLLTSLLLAIKYRTIKEDLLRG